MANTTLLTYVLSVGRRLAEIRSLDPLLRYFMAEMLPFAKAERGYLFLQDANGRIFHQVGWDNEGNVLAQPDDEVSHTILREALQHNRPVISHNAMQEERFTAVSSVQALRIRSIICTPLVCTSRTIGALYVENRQGVNRFRQEDIAPIQILANQAAVSIENALLNDQLQQAHDHLQQLTELKHNFIMLISHELRTPLTSVTAYAELLQQHLVHLHQQALSMGEQLESAVKQLQQTIQEIIYVFRILSGQLQLWFAPVHMWLLVETALVQLRQTHHIQVYAADLTFLPSIQGDEEHLTAAIYHVLVDAAKQVGNGGELWINGRLQNNQLQLLIHTHTPPPPHVNLQDIFDIFHKLNMLRNQSDLPSHEALNFNLPISHGLITAHNGTIQLEPYTYASDVGTLYTISLPVLN